MLRRSWSEGDTRDEGDGVTYKLDMPRSHMSRGIDQRWHDRGMETTQGGHGKQMRI